MPPHRRKHRQLGTDTGNGSNPAPNMLLDEEIQTDPVSPLHNAEWGAGTDRSTPDAGTDRSTPPPPHIEPGSPSAVPDGATGTAPLSRFVHVLTELRDDDEYDMADPELEALTSTMIALGILQAVTVVSRAAWLKHHPDADIPDHVWWCIVMGGRRLSAATSMGRADLPFLRNDVLADPIRALESGLAENNARTPMKPLIEARAFQQILEVRQESVRNYARRTGKTHTYVNRRLALLNLIGDFQALVTRQKVTVEKAQSIAALTPAQQQQLYAAGPPYSIRALFAADTEKDGRVLSKNIRLTAGSDAETIVKAMRAKFPPELLEQTIALLTEEGEQS